MLGGRPMHPTRYQGSIRIYSTSLSGTIGSARGPCNIYTHFCWTEPHGGWRCRYSRSLFNPGTYLLVGQKVPIAYHWLTGGLHSVLYHYPPVCCTRSQLFRRLIVCKLQLRISYVVSFFRPTTFRSSYLPTFLVAYMPLWGYLWSSPLLLVPMFTNTSKHLTVVRRNYDDIYLMIRIGSRHYWTLRIP